MSEQRVTNLNQAISVLVQAAEHGRKAGIFEWEDLDLISQSLKLINHINAEQQKAQAEADAQAESSDEETKEVVLEPTKED